MVNRRKSDRLREIKYCCNGILFNEIIDAVVIAHLFYKNFAGDIKDIQMTIKITIKTKVAAD